MPLQSLKLLRPTVWEKMHLQEKTLFDLGVRVTGNVASTLNIAQYPLHHVTYVCAKLEGATSSGLGEDAFTRKYTI